MSAARVGGPRAGEGAAFGQPCAAFPGLTQVVGAGGGKKEEETESKKETEVEKTDSSAADLLIACTHAQSCPTLRPSGL